MSTITITLTVDTSKEVDQNNLADSCSLKAVYSDGRSDVNSGVDIEDFTIFANIGDVISWEGKAKNNRDIINIKWVKKYKYSTSRIFNRNTIRDNKRGSQRNKIVEATVISNTLDKPDFKYAIKFTLDGEVFYIDPKIKVGRYFDGG